jgi:fumarylacetoacetase
MAIGQHIIDLRVLAESGLFHGITSKIHFERKNLNSLIAQGRKVNDQLRQKVQSLLTGEVQGFSVLKREALVEQRHATMLMPLEIGDYTDFYSSEEHARNVGQLFRSKEDALMPNWKHLPVGYHGRASSIVTTGDPVKRPSGQMLLPGEDSPRVEPTRKLDFELELAFVVGKDSVLGDPVPIEEADDYIFGYVLMNDWSARDIQQWEYRPLGPFLGKSFATAISPWIVALSALEPYKVNGPVQKPKVLPYLRQQAPGNFDIQLEVELKTADGFARPVTKTNSRDLYWSAAQQLAHQTINGCNIRVGDLMASGTISGKEPHQWGSLLEQTYNGAQPLDIHPGVTRSFLEDGDEVCLSGSAGDGNYRVGFGELRNKVVPAGIKL